MIDIKRLKRFAELILWDSRNNLDYIVPLMLWSIVGILTVLVCMSIISFKWVIYYGASLMLLGVIRLVYISIMIIKEYILTTWRMVK